jgi:small subunit ribosomal protein S20
MPQTPSAAKRQRQNEKLRVKNRANRNALKKELKEFEKAVQASPADSAKPLAEVYSALDRAVRKHAIPKGRADRKKARLALLVQRLQKAPAPAPAPAQA